MRRVAVAAAACALLAFAAPAAAEGPGIKLGDDALVLHPGLALGAGYDSNIFYASSNPRGAGYFSVRPALDLSTLSLQRGGDTPHTLDFRLHLGSAIRVLFDAALLQYYSVDVDSGFALTLFPFGNVTFDLFDNFVRTSVPPYQQSGQAVNINSDQNQLGFRLRIRPGGKRLEFGFQYIFGIYLFEGGQFTGKNDLSNDFQLRISWKFFPKTALYLNASETTHSYITQTPSTPPSAFPFRIVVGMTGLITAKLSVNANIGYANSFTQSNANYMNTRSYNMAIGELQGTWKPTLQTAFTLGYRHDFAQALIGTFYELNTAYLSWSQLVWRLTMVLRVAWEMRDYQGPLMADSLQNNRLDNVLTGHLELDFPIKDWLFVAVGDDLALNRSNCQFILGGGPSAIACDYFRNDVWLRIGVAY